jgi:hypothetical protein
MHVEDQQARQGSSIWPMGLQTSTCPRNPAWQTLNNIMAITSFSMNASSTRIHAHSFTISLMTRSSNQSSHAQSLMIVYELKLVISSSMMSM